MLYHVNSLSKQVERCEALKQCSFGGPGAHFTSAEAALAQFTKRGKAQARRVERERLAAISYVDFEYLEDLSKSKVVKLPKSNPVNAYRTGHVYDRGGKADPNLASAKVAAAIRRDLREAVRAEELPPDLEYRVSMTSSTKFSIIVGMKTPSESLMDERGVVDIKNYSAYRKLELYLEALGNQWKIESLNASTPGMVNTCSVSTERYWRNY